MKKYRLLKYLSLVFLFSPILAQRLKLEDIDTISKNKFDIASEDYKDKVYLDQDIAFVLNYVKDKLEQPSKALDDVCKKLTNNINFISYDKASDLVEKLKDIEINFDESLKEKLEKFIDKVNDIKESKILRSRSNKKLYNLVVKYNLNSKYIKADRAIFHNMKVYPGGSLDLTNVNVINSSNNIQALAPFRVIEGRVIQLELGQDIFKTEGEGFKFQVNPDKSMTVTFNEPFAKGTTPFIFYNLYNVQQRSSMQTLPPVYTIKADNKKFTLSYFNAPTIDFSKVGGGTFFVIGQVAN